MIEKSGQVIRDIAHRAWLDMFLLGDDVDIYIGEKKGWELFTLEEHGLYVFQIKSYRFRQHKNLVVIDEDLFIKEIATTKSVTFKETVLSIFNSCKEQQT